MNQATYAVVIFDFDGTLVDSTGAIARSIQAAAGDLGLAVPSYERASHVIGMGLKDALRLAVPDLEAERMPAFIERYRANFAALGRCEVPFGGIEALLDAIARSPAWLAIATAKSRPGLDRALGALGWSGRFVTTRTADEGHPKPHPWMIQDICAELGIAPSQALMIGDTTHDLGMARAAGAAAIGVTYGAQPRSTLSSVPAMALVDTVDALAQHVVALV
ncbi:MAG: HAD-IA family hydrolase [Burkholderiaceae bacterium]|nr:HAD-IA family hydrolase [Burkholderiaceae bacterium]